MLKNPTSVSFDPGADYDTIASFRLDILNTGGSVVRSIDLGKPPLVSGRCSAGVNVRPLEFGTYSGVVVAIAAGVESDPSDPSAPFLRAPGKPGQPAFA